MPYIKSLCNFKMDKELCRTCGKLVPKKNFARHLKSHSDDKKFSCFQCSKRFKRKDKLNCHLQTHRKPEDIKCQYCNHVLHSSRALTKHIKSYHEKVSYSCSYCQKSFTTSDYCKKDTETCKLSVPCICSICKKSFKNISTLDTHQRTQCDPCLVFYPYCVWNKRENIFTRSWIVWKTDSSRFTIRQKGII